MRTNNLPHPSTLSNSDWATPHELVSNPLTLLLNTGHLFGGLIGNTFGMNSNPADQSWDETRYFHYCQTDRPWKAASFYRQYRSDTLKDIKVSEDVAYYLSYLDHTGEFGTVAKPAVQGTPFHSFATEADMDKFVAACVARALAAKAKVKSES